MSHVSSLLRKKERMEITLPILIDYYLTSRKLKGCSPKTITIYRSNLGLFIRFLQSRGHSLRLADLTLQDARFYLRPIVLRLFGFGRPSLECLYGRPLLSS